VKAYTALLRVVSIAAVAWIVSLAVSRLLPSNRELAQEAKAQGARADSLEADLDSVIRELQPFLKQAAVAVAPHEAAMRRADSVADVALAIAEEARAAAADTALALEDARRRLVLMADQIAALDLARRVERQRATERIQPLETVAARVPIVYTTARELAGARRDQVDALEARSSRWRQLLSNACEAGPTVGGAVVGAQVGGPLGAGIGAGGGFLVGVIACP
jgi:hypothetical protein